MGDLGVHVTRYEKISDEVLYSMYREAVFSKLTSDEKLDLLQETVNRDAYLQGMKGAPLVAYGDLPEDMGAIYKNGVIYMNYDGVANLSHEYANCQALNSVLHENIHAWQDQVADGTITIDNPTLLTQYRANDFSSSVVKQNGSYKMGSQYLLGITSPYLYYFQAEERDAKLGAEIKTLDILQSLIERYGVEKSFENYERNMAEFGYRAMEEKAIALYQNPDFERDVNRVLINQKFGKNLQVEKSTEEAVKTEMAASYRKLYMDNEMDNGKEKESMKLDGPVTMEEYNSSLEDRDVETSETTNEVNDEGNEVGTIGNDVDSDLGGDDDLDI